MYSDNSYDFGVAHDFSMFWNQSFLHDERKKATYVLDIWDSIQMPKALAISIRCGGKERKDFGQCCI
jgi:hypothetical protein